MKIRKTFRFKLRETTEQAQQMLRMAGSCRFVWNKMLQLNLARLKRGQSVLHWAAMCKMFPMMKRWWPWLKEESLSAAVQQICRRLHDAFGRTFKKGTANSGRKPRFKRRGQECSMRIPFAIEIKENRARIPKIGWVRFHKSREIVGTLKNTTLIQKSTGWFISIQTEIETPEPTHPSSTQIGIDLGVSKFAALSDGAFVEPINSFRKHEQKLASAQRSLSRKKKGSNNYKKQKRVVAKIHHKITNIRRDFLHKASTAISNSHAVVYVENLQVSSMSRSAKGTMDSPGKNVSAKRGLNKAILDQGWWTFIEMLRYKLEWKGGKLVSVPAQYTSQRCSECGHVSRDNRKSQSLFECTSCEHKAHADINAAINILRAGQSLCGAAFAA